jgi:hypothetical protein
MEAFKSDLGLISSMYPDELQVDGDCIIFTVNPSAEYGVHTLFQFDLKVCVSPKQKISLTNPKGLDETEIINFRRIIKNTVHELRGNGTECFLFTLITTVRQALTDYSDYNQDK